MIQENNYAGWEQAGFVPSIVSEKDGKVHCRVSRGMPPFVSLIAPCIPVWLKFQDILDFSSIITTAGSSWGRGACRDLIIRINQMIQGFITSSCSSSEPLSWLDPILNSQRSTWIHWGDDTPLAEALWLSEKRARYALGVCMGSRRLVGRQKGQRRKAQSFIVVSREGMGAVQQANLSKFRIGQFKWFQQALAYRVAPSNQTPGWLRAGQTPPWCVS